MKRYNGPHLCEDGFKQAEFLVKENEVKEYESGGDEGEDAIIIPAFYNSHTHIADSIVDEPPVGTLEEVVGPGGLKEKKLSSSSKDELASSMYDYLKDALSYGVRYIFEFREGGLEGLQTFERAMEMIDDDIRPAVWGRPARREHDEKELEEILEHASGIGLSAYRDWDEKQIKKVAKSTHKLDRPLAMHCSEDVREPIEEVIDMGVHHLVHMVEATEEDLLLCAEEDIPVVICPRSNLFFGRMPDIPKMIRCGVNLSLGTDNAMISDPNMFREMETAYRLGKLQGDVSPIDILMMSTWNPRKSLKRPCIEEEEETLLILEKKKGDPAYNIIKGYSSRDIIDVVKW